MILRIATAGAITAALLAPTAAHAAKSPWKIVKTTKLAGREQFTDLAVGGRNAAWAFAVRFGADKAQPLAYHWNGEKWLPAALPKGMGGAVPAAEGLIFNGSGASLSASSAKNAWALVEGDYAYDEDESTDPCRTPTGRQRQDTSLTRARATITLRARLAGGIKIKKPARVLRWTGGKWTVARALKDVVPSAIVARGAKETLVFGQNARTGGQVMLRFDGKRWRSSSTGTFLVETAKAEGGAVWVSGYDEKTATSDVRRWNGRRWTSTGLAKALPRPKDGLGSWVSSLSVLKNKATVSGSTLRGELCETEEWTMEPFLLTGNGTWRALTQQGLGGWGIRSHVADGRGGLFAFADNFSEGPKGDPNWWPQSGLFHKTAKGRWKRETLPGSVSDANLLAAVPRTRTVWLAATVESKWDVDGALLRRS